MLLLLAPQLQLLALQPLIPSQKALLFAKRKHLLTSDRFGGLPLPLPRRFLLSPGLLGMALNNGSALLLTHRLAHAWP